MIPRFLRGQEFGKLRLKHTELVSPRVTKYPEIESAFHLMSKPGSAERFKAVNFGLNIIGLQVKVHAFFGDLFVAGPLEKDSDFRVWNTESAIYLAAIFRTGSSTALAPPTRTKRPDQDLRRQ